jgi:hypothetical protein
VALRSSETRVLQEPHSVTSKKTALKPQILYSEYSISTKRLRICSVARSLKMDCVGWSLPLYSSLLSKPRFLCGQMQCLYDVKAFLAEHRLECPSSSTLWYLEKKTASQTTRWLIPFYIFLQILQAGSEAESKSGSVSGATRYSSEEDCNQANNINRTIELEKGCENAREKFHHYTWHKIREFHSRRPRHNKQKKEYQLHANNLDIIRAKWIENWIWLSENPFPRWYITTDL